MWGSREVKSSSTGPRSSAHLFGEALGLANVAEGGALGFEGRPDVGRALGAREPLREGVVVLFPRGLQVVLDADARKVADLGDLGRAFFFFIFFGAFIRGCGDQPLGLLQLTDGLRERSLG